MVLEATVTLPNGESFPIAYLEACSPGTAPKALLYLQSVRSPIGQANPELVALLEVGYNRALPTLQRNYERWAATHGFDLLVAVPSSRNDSQPYLSVLARAHPRAADLSNCFFKNPGWRSGVGHNLHGAIANITVCNNPDFTPYHYVAIVDETISSGNSVGALIHHMRTHGLSGAAEIWLVVPLCMMTLTNPPKQQASP